MILKTVKSSPQRQLSGLLEGFQARGHQGRGSLEAVGIFRPSTRAESRTPLAQPLESLELVKVKTYGEVVLRNRSLESRLIVPMHIGFFQRGAQNHATSQVEVLGPGEERTITDAFCIQECQGGYLAQAHQRFLMLPHALRHRALSVADEEGYSRLWEEIDTFTRRYGVARGGHLERFLRPFFKRLLPFRHSFEAEPEQVGVAFFVHDELIGVEVFADPAQLSELLPVLSIYCYGPSAILQDLDPKERTARRRLDLLGIQDLDDLAERLAESRTVDERSRVEPLQDLCDETWETTCTAEHHGLQILTVTQGRWIGQIVREGEETVYLSLVRQE